MFTLHRLILILICITFLSAACISVDMQRPGESTETPVSTAVTTDKLPVPTRTAVPSVPYELISQESLFSYLEDLTSIQEYSGWRNSGSSGEAEALETYKQYEADIPESNVQVHILEGMDHVQEFEKIDQVLPIILDFIRERAK